MLRDTDGYVSGQELCNKFGVSRTAIWKVINQLKEAGYEIEAAQNKGYHLIAAPDVMTEAELEGLTRADGTRPLLIAVTQLTSTSEERMKSDLLIDAPIDEVIMHYAKNAKKAGLDGVVCSPLEAGKVHEVCGEKFLTVTPGVRFADGDVGDQKRVMTPAEAKIIGSDYIVVGRPITAAADPVAAYNRCVEEFCD